MLSFEKIRMMNFMSYGEYWSEVELNKDQLTAITGSNGNGKCLNKNTTIQIQIDDDQVLSLFQTMFKTVKFDSNRAGVTIEHIYHFYNKYPELQNRILVSTRFGYSEIEQCGITAVNSRIIRVITSGGKIIEGSPDHKLLTFDGKWITLKELISTNDKNSCVDYVLMTRSGGERVESAYFLSWRDDLYDLQVNKWHEFYANGVVSHNSSWASALTFALFGKSFNGAPKGKLINSLNGKHMAVEVEFTNNGVSYKIVRGSKPNIFQIYKEGVLLNEDSNVRDYQSILENQILKLSYKTFVQTVIIGTSSFTPFMELNANDRRIIIEDLLGVGILTTMNKLLKDKIVENSQLIKDNQAKIDLLHVQLQGEENVRRTLLQQHQKNKDYLSNQQKDLLKRIDQLNQQNLKYNDQLAQYVPAIEKYDQLKVVRNTIVQKQVEINTMVTKLVNEKTFVTNNETCPVCHQLIHPEFKEKIIVDNDKKIQAINSQLEVIKDRMAIINNAEQQISNAINQYNAVNMNIQNTNTSIAMINSRLSDIVKQINSLDVDQNQDIAEHNDKIQHLSIDLRDQLYVKNDLIDDQNVYQLSSTLLKDTGIKTAVVNQYLPVINHMVNKYLADMEFYKFTFELDNQFRETIKARGRDDLTYQNLSQGERRRLDMAILFTWRYIASLRNSCSCNLIVVDEILDSSLDQDGISAIMKLFRSFENSHIFVISHRESVQDFEFDKVIVIERSGDHSIIKQ